MTKTILIAAAALAATLHAQNSFQNPAWLGGMTPSNSSALRPDGQEGPITGKPFSGEETRETRQVLSDGTPVTKKEVSKIFRDAEGRTRSESSNTALLFDAPNHVTYVMTKKGCTRNTMREGSSVIVVATENGTHISSHSESSPAKPNPNMSVEDLATASRMVRLSGLPKPNPNIFVEDLGFQVINGVSAKGTRQTLTIPAKALGSDHDIKVVNERWYSDALGILIKSSNVDPRFGSTTYELTSLNQSTPDAALFTPPSGCSDTRAPGMMPGTSSH
jgi:hypothetical protein